MDRIVVGAQHAAPMNGQDQSDPGINSCCMGAIKQGRSMLRPYGYGLHVRHARRKHDVQVFDGEFAGDETRQQGIPCCCKNYIFLQ